MAVQLFEAKDQLDCPQLRRSGECQTHECEESIWAFNGEEFRGCPVKLITSDSFDCLRAYQFHQDRTSPRSGGFLDMGTRYIEVMEIIGNEVRKISAQKEAKMRELKGK